MSTFRLKPDKVRYNTEIKTLDEIHKHITSDFQKKKNLLPKKKLKLTRLITQLDNIQNKDIVSYDDIKLKSKLKTEIEELQEDINDIENNISEADYYNKTVDLIMDYYEMIDNDGVDLYTDNPELSEVKKEDDSEGNDISVLDKLNMLSKEKRKHKKVAKKRKKKQNEKTTDNILSYFESPSDKDHQSEVAEKEIITEPVQEMSVTENVKDRAMLLDKYRSLIDNEYICDKSHCYDPYKKCSECDEDKTLIQAEGIYVCQLCGEVEMVVIEAERMNYKEMVAEKPGWNGVRVSA